MLAVADDDAGVRQGRERARYGVDAPYVPAVFGLIGVIAVVAGVLESATWLTGVGVVFLLELAVYLHTTLRGKFRLWEKLLDQLALSGDEKVLDLGCGRGAVLLAAARRLPRGKAQGVDLWRSVDQSGNQEAITRRNAEVEGVGERVDLQTADMRNLPLPDNGFDVVLSSLAIHNLPTAADRTKVLDEAIRVLRPGGRLVLADLRYARRYAGHLGAAGLANVQARTLGPDGWFTGPWQAISVVTATKPSEFSKPTPPKQGQITGTTALS
jgi:SAM-dependent methyltransferase